MAEYKTLFESHREEALEFIARQLSPRTPDRFLLTTALADETILLTEETTVVLENIGRIPPNSINCAQRNISRRNRSDQHLAQAENPEKNEPERSQTGNRKKDTQYQYSEKNKSSVLEE
ncbi:MAG: uncharacterized protein A8A55_1408 [Amphiamblys sp. WSBS2006]|nr:MAG: uncharacterized protein A8A55_1408 [Amphiamblys sp. WSBS2006]